jgi:short-subunit dehydrogenase
MPSLADKRIILTGGSGGLGELTAAALVRAGAEVIVLSRRSGPERVRHFQADLSSPQGIAGACEIIGREEPDILINMAGVQHFGPAEAQSLDALCGSFNVNLVAPVALCRACLPAMRRRNSGQIVNIGSILGSIACAHFASYSSAKAGLRAFSEALRRELVDTAIAVTYVAPRAVRTRMVTPELQAYAELVGMSIDRPDNVAARIVAAVRRRDKDVYIGFPERVFVRLNAMFPRLVDVAVARRDRLARSLFAS